MIYNFNKDFALQADASDPLNSYRDKFVFPEHLGKKALYFTGNSLGLMPKKVREYINEELDDWGKFGVEGHFQSRRPWYSYHENFNSMMAEIVGAKENEVVLMNGLTTNLHLMMISFYQPTEKRHKILCEKKAFPSDQYMLETQLKHHGYNPSEVLIEVGARDGEETIREEDILNAIKANKDELALIFIGGVNYYTGQLFDMKSITACAHKYGIIAGFDLAHGAGNALLKLHDWDIDFACWCTYKYLNSGPGSVSGVYINEKHAQDQELNRFGGWWGHNKETRFLMEPGFQPIPTAEGWQLSNAPIFSMAPLLASLELFSNAGMKNLHSKGERLSGYLEYVVDEINKELAEPLEIITPREKSQRGCQLSIIAHGRGKELFDKLTDRGVIADWREPNVIRLAPVPMYNSFEDIFDFGIILKESLN